MDRFNPHIPPKSPFIDLKRILRKYHRINLHEREFDGLVEMCRKMIRNNLLKLEGMPPR